MNKLLLALPFLFLTVPAGADDDFYASISYSPVTGASGMSVDQPSLIDAARAARFMCGDPTCHAVITVGNQCAAVAIGEWGALGWANAQNPQDAEAQAIDKCHDHNSDCRVLRTVCTTTRKAED